MDKLIAALVREVRVRDGYDPTTPITRGCAANMELRIKGFLADKLGICCSASVADDNPGTMHRSRGTSGYGGEDLFPH